ncbi:uncharacterized protein METZ01_LOCUS378793 [marine metagenome]|uniref:Uncharacterized protein n=1 Tax=marine metagenome TaxID=408172 RepID=A0A382TV44_9ZZZZ
MPVIIYLFLITGLFLLWQYSKGERIGGNLGYLAGIWGVVIVFYVAMILFF